MALSLRSLRSFVAVAEELHFGAAASRLHMTQPPLSQQIRQLEASLGTELFTRTTRSVQLTVAGEVLLEGARQLLADSEATEHAVVRAGRGEVGRLALGFPNSAAYRLLPRAIAGYKRRYPEVVLDLREMLSSESIGALRSRRLDVVFVRASPAMLGADLECSVVSRDEMVLVAPRTHPLAAHDVVNIKMLEGMPFIGFTAVGSPYFRETLDRIFAVGRVRPMVAHESVLPTLLALVEAGLGVALVPASVSGMRAEQLVYRPVTGAGDVTRVLLHCARRKDETNPAVLNFIDTVHAIRDAELVPAGTP
jgi:DNA-binding transcriptional LysR family regulator